MTLRPYQIEIKSQVYAQWEAGISNVLLCLPTGMGKTKTFCSIILDKAVNCPPAQKLPTAVIVHRKELVQQISLTLAEEGIEHNIIAPRNVVLGIIAAQRQLCKRQFYNPNAIITVVSVDTWNSRVEKHYLKLAKSIKLWIVDEAAHLLKGNKWGKAVSYFEKSAKGLGVTATPERLDKRGLGSHVDGVFDVMVQGPNTRWGIQNGFLSKYMPVISKTNYEQFLKEANGDSDYSKEAMADADENSPIIGDVVKEYIKHASGKQAILFASSTSTAFKMEAKFLEAGIKAKTLTGETDDKVRLEALIDYRNLKIQVLINVDLFDEGLDVPGIECVIMARPTMSLGKYLQMVGRGLRPAKNKPYLILIDHVGNIGSHSNPKHGLPDNHRFWSLDRVKRRKKKINLVRICPNPVCNTPFDRMLLECPYCSYRDEPGKGGGGAGRIGPREVDGDLVMVDPETLRQLQAKVHLERPADLAKRVDRAGGDGTKAMENQIERIKMQKKLSDAIAVWAGKLRNSGNSDRQINKLFYAKFDRTIWEVLGEPRADMEDTLEELY